MSQYKHCKLCSQTLPTDCFNQSKKNKDGLVSWCRTCVRSYNKSYNLQNKQQVTEQKSKYRQANADKLRASQREYYANNKDLYAIKAKAWRSKNFESKKAYDKQYAEANKDKTKAAAKRFALRHPERISLNRQKRRARLAKARVYKVTAKDLAAVLSAPCIYCGSPSKHVDHVIPLSRGGNHSVGNLAPACQECNLAKGSKLVSEWIYKNKTRI